VISSARVAWADTVSAVSGCFAGLRPGRLAHDVSMRQNRGARSSIVRARFALLAATICVVVLAALAAGSARAANVQLFAVPTAAAGLSNIVAGPDGALWFNEQNGFAVGRITTTGEITEFYAAICRQAGEHGVTCDLECIPMWGVVTLERGVEILRDSGVANGGFVFDCTHFTRGGTSLATLKSIPGRVIHCVQVCDGYLPLPDGVTLELECFQRLWPGEGDFAIAAMLDTLNETGGLAQVGPEVFSADMATKTAEDVAKMSRESLLRYKALTTKN